MHLSGRLKKAPGDKAVTQAEKTKPNCVYGGGQKKQFPLAVKKGE